MDILKPEILHEISSQRKDEILKRSMVDVSSVYLETREIVVDIQKRGDVVSIEHYRQYKDNISENDLLVSAEEI